MREFPHALETLQNREHAIGILYTSPALCGESLCLAKQTARAPARMRLYTTKTTPSLSRGSPSLL